MDYWLPERQRIYQWLENDLLLPVFAEAYRGAVNCLFQKTPGHITFVCHTCRDIMNIMAKVYKGGEKASRVQYQQLTGKIEEAWVSDLANKEPFDSNPLATDSGVISITRRAYDSVDSLVVAHRAAKQRIERAANLFFIVFLEYTDIQRIPKRDIDEWEEARIWFQSLAHLRKPSFHADVSKECEKRFLALEQILLTAADSVRARLTALDEILQDTN